MRHVRLIALRVLNSIIQINSLSNMLIMSQIAFFFRFFFGKISYYPPFIHPSVSVIVCPWTQQLPIQKFNRYRLFFVGLIKVWELQKIARKSKIQSSNFLRYEVKRFFISKTKTDRYLIRLKIKLFETTK